MDRPQTHTGRKRNNPFSASVWTRVTVLISRSANDCPTWAPYIASGKIHSKVTTIHKNNVSYLTRKITPSSSSSAPHKEEINSRGSNWICAIVSVFITNTCTSELRTSAIFTSTVACNRYSTLPEMVVWHSFAYYHREGNNYFHITMLLFNALTFTFPTSWHCEVGCILLCAEKYDLVIDMLINYIYILVYRYIFICNLFFPCTSPRPSTHISSYISKFPWQKFHF